MCLAALGGDRAKDTGLPALRVVLRDGVLRLVAALPLDRLLSIYVDAVATAAR
jgi:hypothetical protein